MNLTLRMKNFVMKKLRVSKYCLGHTGKPISSPMLGNHKSKNQSKKSSGSKSAIRTTVHTL